MKIKTLITTCFFLSACQVAIGSDNLAGDWCEDNDRDTKVVMTIFDNGDIQRGKTRGLSDEPHKIEKGFLSVGASSVTMSLDGKDISVDDIFVNTQKRKWWSKSEDTIRKLHIFYSDKADETYVGCKVEWKEIKK